MTFAYPGETESPVLHNISFRAKPGETIAFIGSTGSGKSSLVNLIPRFYDVTLGRILVDGVDVRRYNLKALRSKIGFIPQKALSIYRNYRGKLKVRSGQMLVFWSFTKRRMWLKLKNLSRAGREN